MPEAPPLTQLLNDAADGDADAREAAFNQIYGQLHEIAGHLFRREYHMDTLQVTEIANEAALKLIGNMPTVQDRRHFYGIFARVVRQVLIDYGRKKKSAKRAGHTLSIEAAQASDRGLPLDFLRAIGIDDRRAQEELLRGQAMHWLERQNAEQAQIFSLWYYADRTTQQIAGDLGLPLGTVKSRLRLAKARLAKWMKEHPEAA